MKKSQLDEVLSPRHNSDQPPLNMSSIAKKRQLNSKELVKWVHKFSGVPVLVVGDLMLDRALRGTVDRISPEAPVPVIDIQEESSTAGGAGNVIFNLSALGAT